MTEQQKRKAKPGPPRKARTAKQLTITMDPGLYDRLIQYMENNGLSNCSGTIAMLIKNSLSV